MTFTYLFILFFIVGIVLFATSLFVQTSIYKKTNRENYNFLKFLPFELNQFRRENRTSFIFPALNLISSFSFILAFVFFVLGVVNNSGAITASLILLGLISMSFILFNILNFLKMTNYKAHLVLSIIFGFLQIVFSVLSIIFFANGDFIFIRNNSLAVRIIASSIMALNLIFEVLLWFNPKFKDWNKLEEAEEGVFQRPKRFYLAMAEWGTILSILINFVPVLIIMVF